MGPADAVTPRALQLQRERRLQDRDRPMDAILRSALHHISERAAGMWTRTVYRVPAYVTGLPLYPMHEAVRFVLRRLARRGFFVELYPPDVLYISWDADEIERGARSTLGASGAQ